MDEIFEEFRATKQAALARVEAEPSGDLKPAPDTPAVMNKYLEQREDAWDRATREVLREFQTRHRLEHVTLKQLQDLLTLLDHLPGLFLPIAARRGALAKVRRRVAVDSAKRRWSVVSNMLDSYTKDQEENRLLAIVLAIEAAITEHFDGDQVAELVDYLEELGVETTAGHLISELASAKPGGGARGRGNRGAANLASDLLGGGKSLKDRLSDLLKNA